MERNYPRWTPQIANKARTQHRYILATPRSGRRVISGSLQLWSRELETGIPYDDMTIYIPALRLAGSYNDIVELLEQNRNLNVGIYNNARDFLDIQSHFGLYGYFTVTPNIPNNDAFDQDFHDMYQEELQEYQVANRARQDEGHREREARFGRNTGIVDAGRYTKPARR